MPNEVNELTSWMEDDGKGTEWYLCLSDGNSTVHIPEPALPHVTGMLALTFWKTEGTA